MCPVHKDVFFGGFYSQEEMSKKRVNGVSDLAGEMKVAHLNRLANYSRVQQYEK